MAAVAAADNEFEFAHKLIKGVRLHLSIGEWSWGS